MARRKEAESGSPQISTVTPEAAIPGGEFHVRGKGFLMDDRPRVTIGDVAAPIVVGSQNFLIARVPEGAGIGEMIIGEGDRQSQPYTCGIGIQIAEGLHPVSSPAVDQAGNVFATFSGARGQKTPVSVYKVDASHNLRPFLADIMNATGLLFDRDGQLYISSRHEGTVYQASPTGDLSVYVEGMGVATGLAFDAEGNLYVGDRSGTIFKIAPSRQIYVFATMEPSIAAYHLAFSPSGDLYVTGPTTSSFDCVHKITPSGQVSVFYRGLGRPQGLGFDQQGNLYVASSIAGRRGVVRIDPEGQARLFVSGPNIVGLAFTPGKAMIVATTNALFRIDVGVAGHRFA